MSVAGASVAVSSEMVELFVDRVVYVTSEFALCLINGKQVSVPWSAMGEMTEIESQEDAGWIYVSRGFAEEKGLL